MNQNRPAKPTGSLLERAAEIYDFADALRSKATPVVPTPSAVAAKAVDSVFRPTADERPVQSVDQSALRQAGFVLPDGPISGLSEEFRIIKRQLLLTAAGGRQGEKILHAERILICSAHPGEGKTFCAVNLALSIAAEKDVEVLLVDADFAKPSILSTLGIAGSPGLMDALADPAMDVADCVIRTDLPGLFVLPAGRQTNADTEYLASSRTGAVLNALTAPYPNRILIFDSPPILAASPAAALAGHVGQTVLVVRADETTETALRDAVGLLAACDNIQLLLNGVKFSPGGRRFGSYYGQGGA
ncbi:AAA family ATPase [Rhizorhapis sp.]|uniref:AAA family ATPase n=1 Tax=Rhizorhapis sp. TaxID=1968842 RepID=UPI002B46C3C8|nr:AAA family ATPase [Rhizorhapis sp.]HKR16782.1 AAA family ATPase [Rhizorhapis sp.]